MSLQKERPAVNGASESICTIIVGPGEGTKAKQRAAILSALRTGPLSTVDAREVLGIMHPAGRIKELRQRGFEIATVCRMSFDAQGRPHLAACYVLREGAQ
jgi:hypothetical protein